MGEYDKDRVHSNHVWSIKKIIKYFNRFLSIIG